MRETRLVFVEGIMGAGKTTTGEFLTSELLRRGVAARFLPEGPTHEAPSHPLRIAPELPHPNAAWIDLPIGVFAELSLQKWRAFVREAKDESTVIVCDGLLFHGNLTDLMMMDAEPPVLHDYIAEIVEITRPLQPVVIYYYNDDVEVALRRIVDERGKAWEAYQVNWKVSSPYAVRRGLQGFGGLVQLYRDYRALCDRLLEPLPLPALAIGSAGGWTARYDEILGFLGLSNPYL